MRIRRIAAYRVELPIHEGSYSWSGGRSVSVFDSTLVRVETDTGLAGHGEVCPLGPSYLPAYAEGVRAGLAVLAPRLIGEDPRELDRLNLRMDAALKGHPYVKAGIDIACWDILGKRANLPVCELLGGRYGADFHLYRAISQEAPEEMAAKVAGYRAEGYRRFQLKVGGDPDTDIQRIRAVSAVLQPGDRLVADANEAWDEDMVGPFLASADVSGFELIEQPLPAGADDMLDGLVHSVPVCADESVHTRADFADIAHRYAAINIKLDKAGGLTEALALRDTAIAAGLNVVVGSMVATYAMARGWNDFWLAWIAVDLVGVPLLIHSGFYPSAVLYAVYGVLVIYGFFVWLKASRTERPSREPESVATA